MHRIKLLNVFINHVLKLLIKHYFSEKKHDWIEVSFVWIENT